MSGVAHHYRPDIDGLRAVAILSVLLFHASPRCLPGGFVGVDIFFVISGFLITGIILKDLERGNFSFADFYARRIGRIFPSLLLVLIVCLSFGWFILLPDEYVQLAKHTIAGAAFMSNLLLWHQAGYFDAAAQSKPLLHLWSLGIEEQFYIMWPLLLVLFWRRTQRILPMICLLALVSFSLNAILVGRVPSLTFYLPITRTWELLLGSALSSLLAGHRVVRSSILSELFAVLGSLLIVLSLSLISENRRFPGWWALLPTLGTALLIGAGSQAWINRRLLADPVCVFIGIISYPLYLWHWPMLVYLKLVVDSDFVLSPMRLRLLMVGALAVSGCLAWATWRFWETPLRNLNPRHLRVGGLASAMFIVTIFGALSVIHFVTPRLNQPQVMSIVQAVNDWDYPSGDNFMKSVFVLHKVPSRSDRVTLFAGDSHVEQYWPRVKAAIEGNPHLASAVFATSSGCLPLPNLNQSKPGYSCPQFYNYWSREATARDVSTVVIGADWEYYLLGTYPDRSKPLSVLSVDGRPLAGGDIEEAWKGFEATVASLVQSGKRVVILSSNPTSPTYNPRVVFHRFNGLESGRLQPVNKTAFNRFIAPIEERLIQIARRTGATVIRPADYFCNRDVCPATDGEGAPLYKDENHLRAASVAKRAVFIDATLRP